MSKTVSFWNVAIIGLLVMIAVGCDIMGIHERTAQPKLSQSDRDVLKSGNSFSITYFKQLTRTDTASENIIVSPLSASIALGMTLNGAEGSTEEAMQQTLRLEGHSMEQVNKTYQKTIQGLMQMDPKVTVELANAIFYPSEFRGQQLRLNDTFKKNVEKYFDAELSNDFKVEAINRWVSDKTRGKIEKLVKGLNPEDVMVLLNALYFKGDWRFPFDEDNTKKREFRKSDGMEVSVPFMERQGKFAFHSSDRVQVVDLAYGDSLYSMTLIMPKKDPLEKFVGQLGDERYQTWIQNLEDVERAYVQMPKFKFSYEKKLNQDLKAMGMGVAFSKDKANFTDIFTNTMPLVISSVRQKAFIEVNEKGTEAAAATSVKMGTVSTPPVYEFDRPFLFVIRERVGDSILFMGKVGNPKKN